MARRHKTKASKAKKERLEPEDVLGGHVAFRPEDLFDLIHRVNPTNKGLHPREQARRYALKSRLQSLLILQFGDDYLDVSRAEREGVINLDHRSGLRDACHAVLAELEPEARAWVLRQLDLAASGGDDDGLGEVLAGLDEDEAGVGDLLQRGRHAIEEYDYEQAEELLRQAFEESRRPTATAGHAVAAALALLELQVDLLGLDAAALELEPRLSAAAREHAAIRTLLALAAARQGDAESAERHLAGLTPAVAGFSLTRAAQTHAALTSLAIAGHDRAAARRHLEKVTQYDSTHPEIPRLESEIAGLQAEDLRAVEADLEARFRELGAAAVEDEARALADRWPDGEVARRILRQAAAERREAEIAGHLEQAETAWAEERFADAAEHYSAALDAGCERPDLPALAAEATDRARRQEEEKAVSEATEALAVTADGADAAARREALLAYVALADELRARVRAEVAQPAAEWLDELDVPRSGGRAQAAAAAIVALEQAETALAGGEARAAVDLVEPHRAVLRPLERARGLWREAQEEIVRDRRRGARRALEAAAEALEEKGPEAARALLREIDRGDLDAGGLARADELAGDVADAERRARWARRYEERLAAGDLAVALTAAAGLAAGEPSDRARRRWQRRVAELRPRVRSEWRIETVDGELPMAELLQPSHWLEGSAVWLDGEGRELVLTSALERWLFIDVVDVARRRIVDRVSLQTPRPFDRPLHTRREGDRMWIAGQHGEIVELARDGWDVVAYHPVSELVAEDHDVERLRPMAGGRWIWLRSVGPWGGDQVCVADLEEWRMAQRLPFHSVSLTPLEGDAQARIVLSDRKFAARLYTAGGEPAGSQRLGRGTVLGAGVGPDGHGMLMVVAENDDEDEPERDAWRKRRLAVVRLRESSPEGDLEVAARLELPEAHPYSGFDTVVTSPDRGLGFVFYRTQDDSKELLVFSEPVGGEGEAPAGRPPVADSPPLEPLSRSAWHGYTAPVRDRSGRHVGLVDWSGDDLDLRFVGASEPEPFPEPSPARDDSPTYTVYAGRCDRATGEFQDAVEALVEEVEGEAVAPLRTRLGRIEASETATIDDQIQLALALRKHERDHHGALDDAIYGFARRMANKHPRHPGAGLLAADLEAKDEHWAEVRRLLRRPKPRGLDAGRARHFHHLAGLAALHLGRLGEAYKAFRRGMEHEGECKIEPLMHLTQPLSDPPEPEEWTVDQPEIRRLVAAIRTADHALAGGDPAAARAALDRRDLRWKHELQIAARRAHVYLEAPPATAAERFGERVALALFLQLQKTEKWMRQELFLPGLHWEKEKLAEIETRARARLENPRG